MNLAAPSACLTPETAVSYASGRMSDVQLAEVEEHIDTCSRCRRLLSHVAEAERSSLEPPEAAPSGPAAAPLSPGARVGRYVVDAVLGAGGMGVVYAAHDTELGRDVALKALRHDLLLRGRSAEELLRREAKAMARLEDPHVVGVFDLFAAEGTFFVAMELVDGGTLRDWLRAERRSPREILEAVIAAGRGLAAAHARGIVHRDFKPENVLRAKSGRVCVSDFGLARVAEAAEGATAAPPAPASAPTLPNTGWAGTPLYMAPEQRMGGRATALSDQYSFCVVLHEALTGRRPGDERPGGRKAPRQVKRVLARGLERDPGLRYPSMVALLADLERLPLRGWSVPAVGFAVLAATALVGSLGRAERAPVSAGACAQSEALLGGVWDDAQRGAVERAFQATGKPYADDAWRGVRASLDAYTADWVSRRVEACEATSVHARQPQRVLELEDACLDDRLAEVGSLVRVLARADERVVSRAYQATQSLGSLQPCADAAALSRRATSPSDPAAVAASRSVRARLSDLKALDWTGRYKDALARADGLIAEAEATRDRGLVAQALYWFGQTQYRAGAYADAEPTLRRAVRAADAAGDDPIRVEALRFLIGLLGKIGKFDAVAPARDEAIAVADRIGADEAVAGDLYETLGIAAHDQGKDAEARALIERSIEHSTRAAGPESWPVGVQLADLATTYGHGEPEALDLYGRALAIETELVGPDHPTVAYAENGIGCVYLEQARPDDAEAHLRRASAILEASSPEHPNLAAFFDNLALSLADQSKFADALIYNQRSLALSEKLGRAYYAWVFDTLRGLGRAYVGLSQPALAVAYLERGMRMPSKGSAGELGVAEAEFTLARALDGARHDRANAIGYARKARASYQAADRDARDEVVLAAIDAWLAAHP